MRWAGKDEEVVQAVPADPRVTRLGRFLRRTSMDELPQLINVVRGEMSLIGPRPHAIEHDFHYMNQITSYNLRFRARPGLTGLAQVCGARGRTPHLHDMGRRIRLDLLYMDHASIRLDCRILLTTWKEVMFSDSAW